MEQIHEKLDGDLRSSLGSQFEAKPQYIVDLAYRFSELGERGLFIVFLGEIRAQIEDETMFGGWFSL